MMRYFLLFFIYASSTILAQNTLKVEYEMVRNVQNIPGLENPNINSAIRDRIMQNISTPEKQVLYYKNGNSFYKNIDVVPEQVVDRKETKEGENKTVTRTFKTKTLPVRYYHSKGDAGIYSYHHFNGESFYSDDKPVWKKIEYKNEIQKIDAFDCKLAEVTLSNGTISKVWYTEHIPISIGPLNYHNFPGLVLKIEAPTFTVYATKVSNDAKEAEIEKMDPKLKIYSGEEWAKKKEDMLNPQVKTIRKSIQL